MHATRLRLPFTIFGLIAIATIALNWLPNIWNDWQPDYCRAVNCYCEPFREGFVLQTTAAYSNLGFALVGLLILSHSHERSGGSSDGFSRPNPIRAHSAYPASFGLTALLIGAGSFFYHASLTRAGEWFDLMGMYLFTSLLMLYNLARLRPLTSATFAAIYLGLNTLFGIQMILARELQQIVFGLLVGGALGLEAVIQWSRRPAIRHRYFVAALGCFAVGAVIWLLDSRGALPCWPESLFQWHALWHLLTAASAGLLYLYYRSERE
jgi:hypothetical protein